MHHFAETLAREKRVFLEHSPSTVQHKLAAHEYVTKASSLPENQVNLAVFD